MHLNAFTSMSSVTYWIPGSMPSPNFAAFASATRASQNSAKCVSWTNNRLMAMQTCPLFSMAALNTCGATAAGLASRHTMAAWMFILEV